MERYENLGLVGEGSYGTVLKCRHKETGRLVAIKKFLDSDDDKTVKKIALREIKLLKQLRHDNLVNLLEVWKRRRRWYLVFEFVESTLLDELETKPHGLDPTTSRQYLYQILSATAFCHQQNVIHRDIKPENILISQGGVVKLCDFGFARTVASPAEGGIYTDYVATRWYRPPELLVGDLQYGKPVDVWALGCLLLEMLTSQPLFPGDSDLDQIYHIVRCFGNLTSHHQELFYRNPLFTGVRLPECSGRVSLEQRFHNIHPAALDLAQSCLQMDPDKRPDCSELLEHTFFTHDSFHIRFADELNTKIQKDHRDNSTLPKINKSTRHPKDEAEERERKGHKLPVNVDEKLKTKKEPGEDKTAKNKNKQSSKLPKTNQNASEMATKQVKTQVTKENAAKISTPMKTKAGKTIEASTKSELNPTFKAPKQDELTKVEDVKDTSGLANKVNGQKTGPKFIKNYAKADTKTWSEQLCSPQLSLKSRVLETTGEHIVMDSLLSPEESEITPPKFTKTSHFDASLMQETRDEVQNLADNVEKISREKSSQTMGTCLSKNSINVINTDACTSKQLTNVDLKAVKTPIQKTTPIYSKTLITNPDAIADNNLRIQALINNLQSEKAQSFALGSQQDGSKHLNKGFKDDSGSKMAADDIDISETSRTSGCTTSDARLAAKTPEKGNENGLPKALKVSDKENRREDSTGSKTTRDQSQKGLKSELKTGLIGSLTRSCTLLASKKSLKGFQHEVMRKNVARDEAIKAADNMAATNSDRYDEDSSTPLPPPPPSSTPLLLPPSSVVMVTGERLPANHLRIIESKHFSQKFSPAPALLPSTVPDRCLNCERSFISDHSKKKMDVYFPEVRNATLPEFQTKDGKSQKSVQKKDSHHKQSVTPHSSPEL